MKANKKASGGNPKGDDGVDWNTAIEDAETEIKRLRRRISVLEGGIEVFRDRRDHGEQFPGKQA